MNADSPNHYRFLPHGRGAAESTSMDPRLQRLVAMRRLGRSKPSTSSTDENEVAVIAKVASVEAFEALSEVTPGVRLGDVAEDGTTIVTGADPGRQDRRRPRPRGRGQPQGRPAAATRARGDDHRDRRPARGPAGRDAPRRRRGGRDHRLRLRLRPRELPPRRGRDPAAEAVGPERRWRRFARLRVRRRARHRRDRHRPRDPQPLRRPRLPARAALARHPRDGHRGRQRPRDGRAGSRAARRTWSSWRSPAADIPWSGADVVGASFGDSVQLLEALAFVFE